MDWYDFIAGNGEKYGMTEEDFGPFKKCAIIRFDYDDRGNVSGTYRNLMVYRHTGSENVILPGETWICSLSMNNATGKNYFAKPVEKIDASFFFALLANDREVIIETIWKNHQNAVYPLLEEKFKDVIAERIKDAEIKVSNEKESIINELNDINAALEKKQAEDAIIIESLHSQIKELKDQISNIKQNSIQENKSEQQDLHQNMALFQEPKVMVNRIGPDTISSDYFTKSRYFVHLSADQRMMVVRPSDKGNVVCMNNTIVLSGLSFVSNYTEPCEMISQYNPKYGGVQIYLK